MHSSQCVPFRGGATTIVLPPQKVPRPFVGSGQDEDTGFAIPENHGLCVMADGNVLLTLSNPGDTDIVLPCSAGFVRIIPIRQIGSVTAHAGESVNYTLWIEDLRGLEPWQCFGAMRP